MKKNRVFLLVLLIVNIFILISSFLWLLSHFSEYILDINDSNRVEVIYMLDEIKSRLPSDSFTKLVIKQELGNARIFFYNEENNMFYDIAVNDNAPINDYIRKKGKKVGVYQEKIYNFSKIFLLIVIIMILINELLIKFSQINQDIYLPQAETLIGSESLSAERVRKFRERQKQKKILEASVTTCVTM